MDYIYTKQQYKANGAIATLAFVYHNKQANHARKTRNEAEKPRIYHPIIRVLIEKNNKEYSIFDDSLNLPEKQSTLDFIYGFVSDGMAITPELFESLNEFSDTSGISESFLIDKISEDLILDDQTAELAIEQALLLDSVELRDIEYTGKYKPKINLADRNNKKHDDWQETLKIETSLGSLMVGFGFQRGTQNFYNLSMYWPGASLLRQMLVIKFNTIKSNPINKEDLFSFIGFDNLFNFSTPGNIPTQNLLEISHDKV